MSKKRKGSIRVHWFSPGCEEPSRPPWFPRSAPSTSLLPYIQQSPRRWSACIKQVRQPHGALHFGQKEPQMWRAFWTFQVSFRHPCDLDFTDFPMVVWQQAVQLQEGFCNLSHDRDTACHGQGTVSQMSKAKPGDKWNAFWPRCAQAASSTIS